MQRPELPQNLNFVPLEREEVAARPAENQARFSFRQRLSSRVLYFSLASAMHELNLNLSIDREQVALLYFAGYFIAQAYYRDTMAPIEALITRHPSKYFKGPEAAVDSTQLIASNLPEYSLSVELNSPIARFSIVDKTPVQPYHSCAMVFYRNRQVDLAKENNNNRSLSILRA